MTESEFRAQFQVPAEARYVLMFSQSSHLDWDWKVTFPTLCNDPSSLYFTMAPPRSPAFQIFDQAVGLMLQYKTAAVPYYYSVAEIGFLQSYAESTPQRLANLRAAGTFLHLCGGGITSPDNLLPHGETFIRNSLVAKRWYSAALALPVTNLWVPDDFGHDSQLPVVVSAMGLVGAGFARVPGTPNQTPPSNPLQTSVDSIAQTLTDEGADFRWYAADGSMIIGHWLCENLKTETANYYCQGDSIDSDGTSPAQTNSRILGYFKQNQPSSPTPYIFVAIGCDFAPPKSGLLTFLANWNQGTGSASYAGTGAYAVAATFDHYIQQVALSASDLKARNFDPTPYWLGFYASRPANKILHYSASRALLAAEVLGVIAGAASGQRGGNAQRLSAEQAAWSVLVPSTHHDYITGTSDNDSEMMDVNALEQLPRLQLAQTLASDLRGDSVRALAQGIAADVPQGVGQSFPVVVCNALGFARSGLVALPDGAGIGAQSVAGATYDAVQPAHDGSLLFSASAPSLGYSTVYLSTNPASGSTRPLTISEAAGSVTLANEYLRAVINAQGDLSAIADLTIGSSSMLNGSANRLAFYTDNGNIYRYGNEGGGDGMTPVMPSSSVSGPLQVLETGPLRLMVQSTSNITLNQQTFAVTRTYTLVAGEPFLRMSITGALPASTSLFVQFGFRDRPIDALTRGTTYHWTDQKMVLYWQPPVFHATHDFVIPTSNQQRVCAIYHEAVPSWGYDAAGNLLGNVLRNTLGQAALGAAAADVGVHTQHYALRVVAGLGLPETAIPLREAMQFHTPMLAAAVAPPPLSSRIYPPQYSLAAVEATCPAILTVAKAADDAPGDLILRVYQPTNNAHTVPVTTSVDASRAAVQTALEGPFENRPVNATLTSATSNGMIINMQNALATIRLPGVL